MPVLQASIKSAKQDAVRRTRRQPFKTNMKTMIRKVQDLIKEGKSSEAQTVLSIAYKAIDTAAKKHIIHRKNADRKKSSLARLVATKKK